MKLKSLLLSAALTLATLAATAQSYVTGRVLDGGANNAPLVGALIVNAATGDVAIAQNDGSFRIRKGAGEASLSVEFMGYAPQTVVSGGGALGDITLMPDAITVQDIRVVAGIVTDRRTPVAVSNVTRANIEMKLSNQEFPELLKSTPSVYATKESGGYGDSRITMRGFQSENIGVLVNGVPINDMENGKVYWSNWAGLSDVTSLMQVQRGLGASKLALSSVGGTINIVTRSTDANKGGSVYYGIGNDGLQKLNVSLSTGLMDNGWALSLAGGRQAADGYVRGTNYLAWNYFANLSKVFAGGRHRLSLTAIGSPQWHNQRGNPYLIEDYQTHPDRRRMNRSWGYKDGKVTGGAYGYNHYHKPHLSLVHTWQIDDKSSLSTSVYASLARGGGRRAFAPNGSSSNLLAISNTTGRPTPETMLTPEGHLDFDRAYEMNRASADGSAAVILGEAVNRHDWYGLMSTYNTEIRDFKITAGFDGRYYKAFHGSAVTDLLGADYYLDNSIKYRPEGTPLYEGDYVQYDETGEVLWTGLFAQGEYVKERFSAFASASISANFYRWHNPGVPYKASDKTPQFEYLNGETKSKWVNFVPWSFKAGASYKLGSGSSVFVNGGYFTRAPFFNSSFMNYTIVTNPDAKKERVATAEAGYQFANNTWNVTVNGYYTLWLDKGFTRNIDDVTYNVSGVNARHMGLEAEAEYRPSTRLNIHAMGSLGDWIWRDNVDATQYDENQKPIGAPMTLYLKGVHVGNSAQMTAALGVNYEVLPSVRIGADVNWYGKNFADFQPTNRSSLADAGVDAWQMPDYATVDLQLSYRFKIGDMNGTFYGNLNNLLNTWYIADARDGSNHTAQTALVYYGFGRTWTAGLKFTF